MSGIGRELWESRLLTPGYTGFLPSFLPGSQEIDSEKSSEHKMLYCHFPIFYGINVENSRENGQKLVVRSGFLALVQSLPIVPPAAAHIDFFPGSSPFTRQD
jgi:hypothetical protein